MTPAEIIAVCGAVSAASGAVGVVGKALWDRRQAAKEAPHSNGAGRLTGVAGQDLSTEEVRAFYRRIEEGLASHAENDREFQAEMLVGMKETASAIRALGAGFARQTRLLGKMGDKLGLRFSDVSNGDTEAL